ncbi:hypothetical protein TRVL_09823 [Trypanosoma vivax]|nr:hypothetical protein TRVL_09823 [Trypanosoma vivax]
MFSFCSRFSGGSFIVRFFPLMEPQQTLQLSPDEVNLIFLPPSPLLQVILLVLSDEQHGPLFPDLPDEKLRPMRGLLPPFTVTAEHFVGECSEVPTHSVKVNPPCTVEQLTVNPAGSGALEQHLSSPH